MYSVHVFMLSKVSLQLDYHNQNHSYSVCILRHSFHSVFFILCSSYANHPVMLIPDSKDCYKCCICEFVCMYMTHIVPLPCSEMLIPYY